MDVISALFWAALAAIPLVVAAGWLIGPGERELGAHLQGRDAWWHSTMPWPRGVQEDDEVHWGVRETNASIGGRDAIATSASSPVRASVRHLRPRVRIREP